MEKFLFIILLPMTIVCLTAVIVLGSIVFYQIIKAIAIHLIIPKITSIYELFNHLKNKKGI